MDSQYLDFKQVLNACSSLSLRLYKNCPVGCSHCCISATPGKPIYTCDYEECIELISEIAKLSSLQRVTFTGPEIVLNDQLMVSLGNYIALSLGLPVGVLTSGFWATSDVTIQKYITYLREASISIVQVSFDTYHPLSTKVKIEDLISLLMKEGFYVSVLETIEVNETPRWPKIDIMSDNYEYQYVALVGRHQINFDPCNTINDIPKIGCDFGTRIYVENDRNIYLCSGPGCKVEKRSVGRVSSDGRVIWNHESWPRLKALYPSQGPQHYFENNMSLIKAIPKSGNPCTACWRYFSLQ